MSTRSSIYYHEANEEAPNIHIFTEMCYDDRPDPVRMEIETAYAVINIPLPKGLQERLGLRPRSTR